MIAGEVIPFKFMINRPLKKVAFTVFTIKFKIFGSAGGVEPQTLAALTNAF